MDREIPGTGYDNETRSKILDVATDLFAKKGFGAVSMRDIAKAVGIKMGSIYYYYKGKDALLEDIFARFESGYVHYFEWLAEKNSSAETLEEVLDNMFNKEFLEMQNPIACFGMSLALKEQHHNKVARKLVFDILCDKSIGCLKADFDRLIQKGVIPESDTTLLSMLFMFSVLMGNDLRIHEFWNETPSIDCVQMYYSLKKFLSQTLSQSSNLI